MDCTNAKAFDQAVEEHDAANDGVIVMAGHKYMQNGQGHMVPLETVSEASLLQDQTVRKIIGFAEPLSAQVARFRQHAFQDVDTLLELLGQKYGVQKGGQRGNVLLMSYDGCQKVEVQNGDFITFGPELKIAKDLVDQCLREWTAESGAEIRAIVEKAFQVNKYGKINTADLLGLRQLKFEKKEWQDAMQAINDSIQVVGSKRYVRCYRRANREAAWEPIVINVAAS
jgi:hypothetical protein